MVKIWKQQDIRVDQIKGSQCAWKDCTATFSLPMPKGWVWLVTYWAPTPQFIIWEVPQRNMSRDAVLCPKHAAALERLLTELGGELDQQPAAGSA
jgi:hypothetical protein